MITQSQYAAFRESSLANQPIRRTCQLADLRILTLDTVEYKGLRLGLSRTALKDLVKITGLSISGFNDLEKTLGEDSANAWLNSIKNAIGIAKSMQVTMVVSPDRILNRVYKTGQGSSISAETYFDTFERIANRHNLEVKEMSFNPTNGNCYISALSAKGDQFQVGNLSDEVFTSGISLANTADGILADPFLHRLVCTNGMVTRSFNESFQLQSMDPRKWQEFYTHMDRIEKMGFVPTQFSRNVELAIKTPASLKELETATSLILNNSNCPEDELEYFIKGHRNTYARIHDAGIDTERLTNAQKANLRTGVSVWDCINGITDFASHNYGYEKKLNADRHMQVQAGNMLCKTFDTANLILDQPF